MDELSREPFIMNTVTLLFASSCALDKTNRIRLICKISLPIEEQSHLCG